MRCSRLASDINLTHAGIATNTVLIKPIWMLFTFNYAWDPVVHLFTSSNDGHRGWLRMTYVYSM